MESSNEYCAATGRREELYRGPQGRVSTLPLALSPHAGADIQSVSSGGTCKRPRSFPFPVYMVTFLSV